MVEHWTPFPHPDPAFDYAGERLAQAWPRLHAGDREPFPDHDSISAMLVSESRLGDRAFGTDARAIAEGSQDAWRAFHRGDFQRACELAMRLGPLGRPIAIAADGVQTFFLMDGGEDKISRCEALVQRAGDLIDLLPLRANSHYRYAWALGLLSRQVPALQVLAEGLGSKLHAALDAALDLDPDHAEAHTAIGLYHAQVIDKIGAALAKLTWRVDPAAAEAHLRTAIRLTPDAPNAWVGLGVGLGLLDAPAHADERIAALRTAAEMHPLDARQALEIAYAKSKLAKLANG